MVGRVEIFASFVVVVHKHFSFLYLPFCVEKDGGLAINLATHSPHILMLSFRVFHAVIDPVEEAGYVGMLVRDHNEGRGWAPSAQKFHYRVVKVSPGLLISPHLAQVLSH